jgi:O-antigen/teichoic acid export membrane protein
LVLGGGYDGAVSLVRWTTPYLLTAPAASLLAGTMLYAMGRHRAYLVSTAGGAIAAIILYCALTPALGVRGAVLAFVLSEASVAAIAYLYLPVRVRGLWRSRLILVAIAASLLMALSVAGLARATSHLTVLVPFGTAVYGLAVFAMGKKQLFEIAGASR